MKKYLKHFAALLIMFAMVLIIFVGALIAYVPANKEESTYTRRNTECLTTERVFDQADVLTDSQEESLRSLIAETEPKIGCDIVLVTISDPQYAGEYNMRNYADDFYDNNKFGYNAPCGDGALYLDNFLGVGNSYSWFSTCGRVESRYSTYMIDTLIDDVCRNVNNDPYGSYVVYIKSLERSMSRTSDAPEIPAAMILGVAFVVTLIYFLVCINRNVGKKTTNATTYVEGGHPNFTDHRDILISKHTTHHRISSSSGGGGGGGHHISSGGISHGGGGGRH